MRAGRRNQVVRFFHKVGNRAPDGQAQSEWVEKFSDWAAVAVDRGQEARDQGKDKRLTRVKISLRYRDDFIAGMRAETDIGIFDIEDFYPVGVGRSDMELLCRRA